MALDPRQKAERIAALFRERRQVDILPAELLPPDLDEAYAIRGAFEEIERARGRGEVVGYKIGLTTPIMQKLCSVDEPCYGAIFASEVHHRRAELPARNYCRLGIETEIAVRLGRDLPQGGSADRVAAAVESCMAAIEVLEDLRHDYKRLSAAAMVAGNVWNAGVVLGQPVSDWGHLDLARLGARLTINGVKIIDKLVPQAATEWSGSIDLVAGQKYSFAMDYFDRYGGALAQLQWAGPGISKQVVPQSAFFPF